MLEIPYVVVNISKPSGSITAELTLVVIKSGKSFSVGCCEKLRWRRSQNSRHLGK